MIDYHENVVFYKDDGLMYCLVMVVYPKDFLKKILDLKLDIIKVNYSTD